MQDRGYDAHVQTGETEDSNSENHVHCPNYWRYMRAIALPSAWILQEVKALWTDPLFSRSVMPGQLLSERSSQSDRSRQ